jgi:hypothetical protein
MNSLRFALRVTTASTRLALPDRLLAASRNAAAASLISACAVSSPAFSPYMPESSPGLRRGAASRILRKHLSKSINIYLAATKTCFSVFLPSVLRHRFGAAKNPPLLPYADRPKDACPLMLH